MNFNIVLHQLDIPKFKIFNAYVEVIDSLQWALRELGHTCTISRNTIDKESRNIVFGWEVAFQFFDLLHIDLSTVFPEDTILFNLEQHHGQDISRFKRLTLAAQTYEIWDYSFANIEAWNRVSPKNPVFHCPIGYSPTLEKIAQKTEDIDVAFIGRLDEYRFKVIKDFHAYHNGIGISTFANVWGSTRDELIGRTKVLLNISSGNPMMYNIFEIVRASYYFANRKAVVCEGNDHLFMDEYLKGNVFINQGEEFAKTIEWLCNNESERKAYAENCYELFKKQDFRNIVGKYFQSA